MKKILPIFVISFLIGFNASAEIIDLKCVWNNGYTIPSEDVSSNKGRVNFYKIDLKNKKVTGSPHGYYENKKSEYSDTWVRIREDTISFGINAGDNKRIHSFNIDRNTGVLKESHSIDTGQLKGLIINNYLCEKTKIKKKF